MNRHARKAAEGGLREGEGGGDGGEWFSGVADECVGSGDGVGGGGASMRSKIGGDVDGHIGGGREGERDGERKREGEICWFKTFADDAVSRSKCVQGGVGVSVTNR